MNDTDAPPELAALLRGYLDGSADPPAEALRAIRDLIGTPPGQQGGAIERLADAAAARPDKPYLRLLLAQCQAAAGDRLGALRSWHQASLQRSQLTDGDQLHVLGLRDREPWRVEVARFARLRSEYLRDSYADIRRNTAPRELFRIERALAGYLGEATVISSHPTQRPKFMFVPGLRGDGFLDPASHPLVAPLEAAAPAMRAEFERALAEGAGIEPFLGHADGQDLSGYVSGGEQAAWDAIFFYRHGRRYDDNHARFPHTSQTLEALDLCRIDGQAPEICFSIMRPGTRIEPHHGVTNARVVVHIPLRVPEGCYLEVVGIGRHHWREGQAMVFDDTFEHGAVNPSGQLRGILLMDSWHPDLTPPERAAFRALVEAVTRIEALDLNG